MFKAQTHQCEKQTGSNPIGPYLQTKVIHILSMQTLQIHDSIHLVHVWEEIKLNIMFSRGLKTYK